MRANLEIEEKKSAERGVPSLVWRAGQDRRLQLILQAAGNRCRGVALVDGCGVGMYLNRLAQSAQAAVGLEIEFERCLEARQRAPQVLCGAGERLPFPADIFDLVVSHEVLEHVQDDRQAVCEIVRALKPGGRLVLFCPNRGYPFETHGIYWRGTYHFGNIPLVNYLPRRLRDRLAPHVRVYSSGDLQRLFAGLPVKVLEQTIIYGAYDNIIARYPWLGRRVRALLRAFETTPLRSLGLSHFWVVEKFDPKEEIDP